MEIKHSPTRRIDAYAGRNTYPDPTSTEAVYGQRKDRPGFKPPSYHPHHKSPSLYPGERRYTPQRGRVNIPPNVDPNTQALQARITEIINKKRAGEIDKRTANRAIASINMQIRQSTLSS